MDPIDQQVKVRGFSIQLDVIEATLLSHRAVKAVAVVPCENAARSTRLVAYVVASPAWLSEASSSARTSIRDQWIGEWQAHWNRVYNPGIGVGPDFAGWDAPSAEMQEWVSHTVRRIEALHPVRVLEIGCGVGLLLDHLAPKCERYRGTDISGTAIARLREWIQTRPDLSHVEISRTAALELDGVDVSSYDTVVLNSVVQYFPDVGYLLEVLDRVMSQIKSEGRVFLGDIWNLHLVPAFRNSSALERAPGTWTVGQLRTRIARALEADEELFIAPEFWLDLPSHRPEIRDVEIALKRGRSDNQMTRYRYDVTLRMSDAHVKQEQETVSWRMEPLSVAAIGARLNDRRPSSLRVEDVPNKRIARDLAAMKLIASTEEGLSVEALRSQLETTTSVGEDPEDFWELGAAHGYDVAVSWTRRSHEGHFDVVFSAPSKTMEVAGSTPTTSLQPSRQPRANNPIQGRLMRRLATELTEHLRAILPEYMVPNDLIFLEAIPTTADGRLDRPALPVPY